MTNYMRPDEQAAYSEIERAQGRDRMLKRGLNTVGTFGVGGLGAGLSSKIMPFLNQYITPDLAMKGINKVSPKLGEFIKKGLSKGLNLKDGLEFIKQNIQSAEQPKQKKNVIQQYSPELHEFITDQIAKGNTALQAAGMAKLVSNKSKFGKAIKQLEKDHKIDLHTLINDIYGKESSRQQGFSRFKEKIKKPGILEEEADRFQNAYGDVMNPPGSMPSGPPSAEAQAFGQQQGGQGQQAIMSILQKIQASRQGQP
jgi:hypothetical protein